MVSSLISVFSPDLVKILIEFLSETSTFSLTLFPSTKTIPYSTNYSTVSVTGDVIDIDMFVEIQFSGTFFEFFKTFVFGKFQAFLFFAL